MIEHICTILTYLNLFLPNLKSFGIDCTKLFVDGLEHAHKRYFPSRYAHVLAYSPIKVHSLCTNLNLISVAGIDVYFPVFCPF